MVKGFRIPGCEPATVTLQIGHHIRTPSKFITLDLQMSGNFRLIREVFTKWKVTNAESHN